MNTSPLLRWMLAAGMAALFGSCDNGPKPPPKQHLENQVALKLPGWCSVRSFEIQVTENVGSKVEPIFKSRFQADIELAQDTFKLDSMFHGVSILAPTFKQGDKQAIYGVSTSSPKGESWQTQVVLETSPEATFGVPKSSFAGPCLIKGSTEESTFRAKVEAERAEAARRAAEAERRRKEQESRMAEERAEQERHYAEQQSAIRLPKDGNASEFDIIAYSDNWTPPISFSGIQYFNLAFPDSTRPPQIYVMIDGNSNNTRICGDRPVQWPTYINSMQFKAAGGSPVKIRVTLDTHPH